MHVHVKLNAFKAIRFQIFGILVDQYRNRNSVILFIVKQIVKAKKYYFYIDKGINIVKGIFVSFAICSKFVKTIYNWIFLQNLRQFVELLS